MTEITSYIGFLAGIITTFSYAPQVYKVWKSRSTKDLSQLMNISLFIGLSMWLYYGFQTNSGPLILSNIISLLELSAIIIMKYKFDKDASLE